MYIEIDIDTTNNSYNNILNKLSHDYKKEDKYNNCFIIKHDNTYWIITLLKNLYGFLSEKSGKNNKKKVTLHLNDKQKRHIILKNIVCIYDVSIDLEKKVDCYYDIYSNMVFIRFDKKEKENINFYNINKLDTREEFETIYYNNKYSVSTTKYYPGVVNYDYQEHNVSI